MINGLKQILHSSYLVWLALFVPSIPMLEDLWHYERYYAELMYESGVLATQLTIVALAISPLLRITTGLRPIQTALLWVQKRRRAIGVAAFGYAALHTIFYVREIGSFELVLLELEEPSLVTGWLAFLILLALAATSNRFSTRRLGPKWKSLQSTSYLAATAVFLHWWLIDQFLLEMLLWFVPLLVLQFLRLQKARMQQTV